MSYNYEHFWDVYRDTALYNPSQRHRRRLIIKEIGRILREKFKEHSTLRLLDVGCGMGYLIHLLHQKYPHLKYCGMDISVSTIERLKTNFTEANWYTCDIQNPLASEHENRYDIVICSEVLEHCEDYQTALDNLARLTAPGGTVLITVPGGPRYRIDADIGHLRHFSLKEASELFSSKQMRVRRAYRWGFPFLSLMRWATDLLYGQVTKHFVNATWSWKQLIFCQCVYSLMFLSWPNSGNQIISIFDKPSNQSK